MKGGGAEGGWGRVETEREWYEAWQEAALSISSIIDGDCQMGSRLPTERTRIHVTTENPLKTTKIPPSIS